jgi:hypothetical protein
VTIPDPLIFLIRVGAIVVEAYHAATVIAAEAILSAVADLADHLPGDNAEQRLGALGLACVGALTLTTAVAVLAVALGVCL